MLHKLLEYKPTAEVWYEDTMPPHPKKKEKAKDVKPADGRGRKPTY
jgi:hypothetical protein